MKTVIYAVIIGAVIASSGSHAVAGERADWFRTCKVIHDLAEEIMGGRQQGMSMMSAMDAVGDGEIVRSLIVSAYDTPHYSTREYQQISVQDFANKAYLECVKSFTGRNAHGI